MNASRLRCMGLVTAVVVMSSGGACSSKGSSSESQRVVCTTTSDGCSCDERFTTASAASIVCDAANYPGTICCAEDGWPSSGSCDCSKPAGGCAKETDGSCRCGSFVSSSSDTAAKQCTPPSGGICCQEDGGSCQCYSSSSAHCSLGKCVCPTGDTAVTACRAPEAKCSSGSKVTSCSAGTSSTGSSSGSTSSSGSSGSTCDPNTDYCSDNGACKCGATCFATCSSCSAYCGVSCTSMSDCDSFRSGYFSRCDVNSSGKGRCLK